MIGFSLFCGFSGWLFGQYCGVEVEQKIPSLTEIQRQLNIAEPDNPIKVDGKVSPDWQNSETQDKWDRVWANQLAARYFTASGAPKQKQRRDKNNVN